MIVTAGDNATLKLDVSSSVLVRFPLPKFALAPVMPRAAKLAAPATVLSPVVENRPLQSVGLAGLQVKFRVLSELSTICAKPAFHWTWSDRSA